jgi:hypothetical protein
MEKPAIAGFFIAGGCPAASFFLLFAQKKETKENGTPAAVLRTSLRLLPRPLYFFIPASARQKVIDGKIAPS